MRAWNPVFEVRIQVDFSPKTPSKRPLIKRYVCEQDIVVQFGSIAPMCRLAPLVVIVAFVCAANRSEYHFVSGTRCSMVQTFPHEHGFVATQVLSVVVSNLSRLCIPQML